jgi:hypothetical protein
MGHSMIRDRDFDPRCGFLSHDEAAILYYAAKRAPGLWVDIGARTGWSAAHIAAAGRTVYAIDPEYGCNAAFLARTEENLRACGFDRCCKLQAATSEQFWRSVVSPTGSFTGICIDGNHDPPQPQRDAMWALPHLAATAVVVYHDLWGWPTCNGVEFLREHGFQSKTYNTPNGMALCWRGDFAPPEHVPDPKIDWKAQRKHISQFWFVQEEEEL